MDTQVDYWMADADDAWRAVYDDARPVHGKVRELKDMTPEERREIERRYGCRIKRRRRR